MRLSVVGLGRGTVLKRSAKIFRFKTSAMATNICKLLSVKGHVGDGNLTFCSSSNKVFGNTYVKGMVATSVEVNLLYNFFSVKLNHLWSISKKLTCLLLVLGWKMMRFWARFNFQELTKCSLECSLSRINCSSSVLIRPAFMCNTLSRQNIAAVATKEDTDTKQIQLPPHALSLIKQLQELGFVEDELKMLMSAEPELMNKPISSWNDIVGSLYLGGFKKSDILTILEKWPNILSLKKKELDNNIQTWFRCDFGQDLLVEVLTTNPTFMGVNSGHVSKRIKQYQIHFESKKRVAKLFLIAPNTLEESWNSLRDKLNYLDELCTEKSDIVASGVLAHSLFHIKLRHEFLIRAGFYKRPHKHFRKRLSRNPKLTSIVNTSDKNFVNNSRLSMFEYRVFEEIFKEQFDNEANAESSDSEEDEDEM